VSFIGLIKKCFVAIHIDLIEIIMDTSSNKIFFNGLPISFQILLPLKLSKEYYYVKQTIIPLFEKEKLTSLRFINIPIKKYNGELYHLECFINSEYSKKYSTYIKQNITPPQIFTKEQKRAVDLIKQGFTASQIADMQKKTKAGVYKLNRKILEKLIDFFEIEFENVNKAVRYYYECFEI
jgi:hypothetical protein